MVCCVCFVAKPKVLVCPSCSAEICGSCQLGFGAPKCVQCSTSFTEKFLTTSGHASLIKSLLRPAEEEILWDREKERLPQTQVLVDWENAVAELSKRIRFGFRVEFPPKPGINLSSGSAQIFPCPGNECRGFVMQSDKMCGSCKKKICMSCRMFQEDNHTCDPDILKNLALLASDSKPCPKCCALIFRTAGCNHMFCTNCRTHFDWTRNTILKNSSNHHYTHTAAFADNVPILTTQPEQSDQSCVLTPLSIAQANPSTKIARFLWHEMRMVQEFLRTRLDQRRLVENHEQALIKVRMQFLRGVSEADCKRKIWLLEKQFEKSMDEANLLSEFVQKVFGLQRRVGKDEDDVILARLQTMISFFNSNFQDLGSKLSLKLYDGPMLNLQ